MSRKISQVSLLAAPGQDYHRVDPYLVAQVSLSTSSALEFVTAELPMLALTFTRNGLSMIIGSLGWLMLAGLMARPAATWVRTSSTSQPSRIATSSISGATCLCRPYFIYVTRRPDLARNSFALAPPTTARRILGAGRAVRREPACARDPSMAPPPPDPAPRAHSAPAGPALGRCPGRRCQNRRSGALGCWPSGRGSRAGQFRRIMIQFTMEGLGGSLPRVRSRR